MAAWIAMLQGSLSLPTAFDPLAWHAHELIFGYALAAIAGFLLTAIPNWTGRLPLSGLPLALLFAAWVLGRGAVATSALLGPGLAAVLDLSFSALLLTVVTREILAGRNWRNLPMPLALALLFSANLLTHLEAMGLTFSGAIGQRAGIAVILLLVSLIGGRILPSFTRNWMAKRAEAQLPVPFGRLDRVCLLITLLALVAWVAAPDGWPSGLALLTAGLAALARQLRWRSHRTGSEPLVWSLHIAYAWLTVGFILLGLGLLQPDWIAASAGLHALTVGAIGSMTLAVMTRATLGHTGRALKADRPTTAIYLLIGAAAATRIAAALAEEGYWVLLWSSSLAWIAAFALFTLHYGRMLLGR